jgi:hypothetical protein
MGIVSTVLGFSGFGFGFSAGIVIGYFIFIYAQPTDVMVRIFFCSSFHLTAYNLRVLWCNWQLNPGHCFANISRNNLTEQCGTIYPFFYRWKFPVSHSIAKIFTVLIL